MNEDINVTLQDRAPGKRLAVTGSVIGAVLVILTLTIDYWAPIFY